MHPLYSSLIGGQTLLEVNRSSDAQAYAQIVLWHVQMMGHVQIPFLKLNMEFPQSPLVRHPHCSSVHLSQCNVQNVEAFSGYWLMVNGVEILLPLIWKLYFYWCNIQLRFLKSADTYNTADSYSACWSTNWKFLFTYAIINLFIYHYCFLFPTWRTSCSSLLYFIMNLLWSRKYIIIF